MSDVIIPPFTRNTMLAFARAVLERSGEGTSWLKDGLEDLIAECKPGLANRPRVVCLCGSTRFWHDFQRANLELTMAGVIVLSIGAATGTDDDHFGNLPRPQYDTIKTELDRLHFRKIEMADEIFVLNRDGYVGESTRREIAHATRLGKVIKYMEDHGAATPR